MADSEKRHLILNFKKKVESSMSDLRFIFLTTHGLGFQESEFYRNGLTQPHSDLRFPIYKLTTHAPLDYLLPTI